MNWNIALMTAGTIFMAIGGWISYGNYVAYRDFKKLTGIPYTGNSAINPRGCFFLAMVLFGLSAIISLYRIANAIH